MQKRVFCVIIFIPEKYVIRVFFFVSMDEPDTPSCHLSGPPGVSDTFVRGRGVEHFNFGTSKLFLTFLTTHKKIATHSYVP